MMKNTGTRRVLGLGLPPDLQKQKDGLVTIVTVPDSNYSSEPMKCTSNILNTMFGNGLDERPCFVKRGVKAHVQSASRRRQITDSSPTSLDQFSFGEVNNNHHQIRSRKFVQPTKNKLKSIHPGKSDDAVTTTVGGESGSTLEDTSLNENNNMHPTVNSVSDISPLLLESGALPAYQNTNGGMFSEAEEELDEAYELLTKLVKLIMILILVVICSCCLGTWIWCYWWCKPIDSINSIKFL